MISIKKVISILLVLVTLLTSIPYTAFALSWDGDSAGGSTNAVNGSSTGYVIRSTSDSACVVGYRFSAVDADGDMKVTKVIDVYRKTANGNNAYSTSAKFSKKYNKLGIIDNKNANLTTTENTTNCYKEANMGFVTELPNPSGVETWQAYETNINKVLSKLGVGSVSNMVYGDKVIIEPLFDVCLAGEYQALTVSEMAYCGRSVLGGSSTGGTSNGTSSTWGFIAAYTNRIWPNKLYTPDGQGLWTGVSAIGSSSKETFNNIMTKGYGVGIAYTEETNNTYTIKFNGNGHTSGSTASMTMTYGVAKNLTANGFSKTGNAFVKWNTKANGTGTSYTNKQSVKNLSSTNGATVNLYAQWDPYDLKVYYNANGGALDSSTYYLSGKNVYKESDNTRYYQTWTYNSTKSNGLVNASTFGMYRTGYKFADWGTTSSGGTIFDEDDATIKPTDLKSSVKTGNQTMTLYAQWKPITYIIKFHGNGSTSGSMSNMTMTYDVAKNLTANAFTKSGYHFTGWNTKADGTGTSYYNKQSVKNLSSAQGAVINLYAQWDTNSYTIAFVGNGNTGGNTSSMTMKFDVAKNLNANGYTRTGYDFSKWNTKANGTGTSYTNKQSVKNLTTVNGGTVYLYAQWNPHTYTIKFNGNGHTSGSTASMSMTYDVAKNLTANGFKKTGYIFDGWDTRSDGAGTDYADKQSVKNLTSTNGGVVTLYAKWKPITYTIKFDGNGATSGSTASMSMTYDVAKNLTANGFTRTYYKFTGWNTKADGSGTAYTDKQSVKNLTTTNGATITLYAQWKYDPVLAVKECDVYSGNKSNKTTLFGITTGNVFDDYVYKTDYPTIGDTVWYNINFPAESKNIKVRQYVKYKGGSWQTRDVTLSSSNSSSQWFPVQFTGNYKTIKASQQYFEIQAKTDWIDDNGNVLKSGTTKTFYIPIKPVVHRTQVSARGYEGNVVAYNGSDGSSGAVYSGQHINLSYKYKAGFSRKDYRVGELETEQIDDLPVATVNSGEQLELPDNEKQEDDFSDVLVTELKTVIETQGEKPSQRVVNMMKEATAKTEQYDNDSNSNDNEGFMGGELADMLKQNGIQNCFKESMTKLRIPQLFTKTVPDLFGDEYEFLEPEKLSEGFSLSGQDAQISFELATGEMYRVDVQEQGDAVPKYKRASKDESEYLRDFLATLPPEAKIRNCVSMICGQINKVDRYATSEINAYVQRIVENMTDDEISAMETAIPVYARKIQQKIEALEDEYREQQFYKWIDSGKIVCRDSYEFPSVITPADTIDSIPYSLYEAEKDDMNNFEAKVIDYIVGLDNVQWWHRIIERKGFKINGYINHYPDFVVKTKSGKIVMIETKGDDRDNSDSKRKLKLGRHWQSLCGSNYRYFMVFDNIELDGAYTIDKFIEVMKEL